MSLLRERIELYGTMIAGARGFHPDYRHLRSLLRGSGMFL
jgi:hypothetical protein